MTKRTGFHVPAGSVATKATLFALVVGAGPVVPSASADLLPLPKGPFHELARFALGGDGGWDYATIDAEERRLYIARSDRVMMVDADSGKLLGEVKGLEGAHGIALVKDKGLGFVTSGRSGEVVAFALKGLRIVSRIKAGENPDAILYEPSSRRVLAFNGKSRDLTAIDVGSMSAVGSLALPGKPEFTVDDGAGTVFVDIEDRNELVALDPLHLKTLATYPLKPCEEPTALSMDVAGGRLVVGCGNGLAAIVDAKTGQLSQSFPVGRGVDATAFDATRGLAFVSAGEGRLTILQAGKKGFRVLQDVETMKSARTLALDAKTGHVFLPAAKFAPAVNGRPKVGGNGRSRVVLKDSFTVLVVGKGD